MAPGRSPDPLMQAAATGRGRALLALAARSIRHGLATGKAPPLALDHVAAEWRKPGACFVTLESQGNLRGCVGSILPRRPMALDVTENAFAAAFRDSRFAPVTKQDLASIDVSLSLMGALEPLSATNDQDLLALLRPHVDGLLIDDGYHRSVFLPQVWDQLPNPADFLAALKRKGGFAEGPWPTGFAVSRFQVEEIPPVSIAALDE
jgi:AmmeMemoRadiSam system protein A